METRASVDIDALRRFLVSVGSDTPDLIFYPGKTEAIYHYTDLNAMQNIIDKHDLWLTNCLYSNDYGELTYGYAIAREAIDEEKAQAKEQARTDYLEGVSNLLTTPPPEGVYICCFCEEDNLLSQWRSYGANGTGVSIGFKTTEFSYITGSDSPPTGLVKLWKVFYDRKRQKSIITRALSFVYNDGSVPIDKRAQQAADAIQFFIPTFKNQDFEGEKEVRLIFTPVPSTRPQFRTARGMLIPYYSLKELGGNPTPPRLLPIVGVQIGPSANKLLNVESTKMLLVKAAYNDLYVKSSDTPFRG